MPGTVIDGCPECPTRPVMVTPASVAIGQDGSFHVSNKGTLAGVGEVLRIQR